MNQVGMRTGCTASVILFLKLEFFYSTGDMLTIFGGLKQINPELFHRKSKNDKASDGDNGTGCQSPSEANLVEKKRESQEHWKCRYHVPKGVPSVVRNFFSGLFFDVQPNQS